MNVVQNKVVILDFTVLASKPKPADVEKFVARDLKVQRQQLKCVQMLTTGKTLLEFYDPAAAKNATTTNMRLSMQCDGKLTPIPVYFKEDTVEVKIYDLPQRVNAEKITKSMSRFGKVLTLERDKWRRVFVGIDNGVYLLRMQLNHHIPKRLTIDGHVSTILYTGQPRNQLKRKRKKHTNKNNKSNTSNENNNNSNENNNNEDNNKEEQRDPKVDEMFENINTNNTEGEKQPPQADEDQPESELDHDEEGFQTVLSRKRKKTLKRQHSEESGPNEKLTGKQRVDLFYRRWSEAKRKHKEAVDAATRTQARRLRMMYTERFWNNYMTLSREEAMSIENICSDVCESDCPFSD